VEAHRNLAKVQDVIVAMRRTCRATILAALLLAACTGSSSTLITASRSASAPPEISQRAAFALARARFVGKIRAPQPAGDDIHLFKPILLAAYDKACPQVLDVQSEIRHTQEGATVIVVSCGHRATRAVRVVYTGATIPDLVGSQAHGLLELGAMLRLRFRERTRLAGKGEHPDSIVAEHPAPGVVVPFGSRVTVVVAS